MECRCEYCLSGSLQVRFRWHLRESLRNKDGQAVKTARLFLNYRDLSIGPVINVHIKDTESPTHPAFYSVELPYLAAMCVEQTILWWLTLRGNQSLAKSGLYEQMNDREKLECLWFPYCTFSATGEAVAIETKLQIIEMASLKPSQLYSQSIKFLTPIPNTPTPKRYMPVGQYGKRGRYDPGPVFGHGNQLFDLRPPTTDQKNHTIGSQRTGMFVA